MGLRAEVLTLNRRLRVKGGTVAISMSCDAFSEEALMGLPSDTVLICCENITEGYELLLHLEDLIQNNELELIVALNQGCSSCGQVGNYVREALLRTDPTIRLEERSIDDIACNTN